MDLTSELGQLVFEGKLNDVPIDSLQKAILLGIGLQNKDLDKLSQEFNMPVNQILAKFYDCCKKITRKLEAVNESTIEKTLIQESDLNRGETMTATAKTFAEELEEDAKKLAKAQKKELKRLKTENFDAFAIRGTDEEWGKALATNKSGIVSVKRYDFNLVKLKAIQQQFRTNHNFCSYFDFICSGEKRLNDPIDLGDMKEPAQKKKKLKGKPQRKSNKF